ncbi:RAMP superfamily CRISPR-associated protein [Thermostichus vulcanus]|uniref:CRISPR-associated protein Csm3 n=1 Tax=Thermostichus vulcanus str. 'Rupite' TaxID=2813851 RepID=A0ABT0C9I1_THEVL|nr:RAMP superfamily CRISPR-associated protein [Thermostichus vulcanus]MCJ2542411.1 CRISPR-associated protein Csm3 [Thermostichus vulcanus str. 'Rupite']
MIRLAELPLQGRTTASVSLTATLSSALSVGSGGSSGSLADKPIVKDAFGRLLIPGSQLKGRLRHECEKLARGLGWAICQSPDPNLMCPKREGIPGRFEREEYRVAGYEGSHCWVCQIFGNPTLPSRLWVDDLVCDLSPEGYEEALRPGVTLNRRRQTAEDQRLYFIETSPATALKFTGSLHLLPDCPSWGKALILAALHHIHALGGSKSAGLGWLTWDPQSLVPLQPTEQDWAQLGQGGWV